ncbi:hypothetical protein BOX15_Mlig002999g1 [Macrostomum lignano]|uniref:CUB domain-containing protein n=1 Tax=Macrostomum lignano TaxID=282301 RepID=A0A267E5F5_9PLAT|nr:hypothetical protein BOX15_Mlig002999g1 [Macrostomum lignano]
MRLPKLLPLLLIGGLATLNVAIADELNCGVNLLYETDQTVIASHRLYGRKSYQPNSVCRYIIRAWSPDYRIEITSVSFDLEYTSECTGDSLTVYSGGNDSSPVLGRFCGSLDWSVLTQSSFVALVFSSDAYLEKGGFQLRYRFVSKDEYQKRIACPNGYLACNSGNGCYPSKWKCDGIKDCKDGSDEQFCTSTLTCPSGQVACKDNSKCIFSGWWCDGFRDCGDGSDETSCSGGGNTGGNTGGGTGGSTGGSTGEALEAAQVAGHHLRAVARQPSRQTKLASWAARRLSRTAGPGWCRCVSSAATSAAAASTTLTGSSRPRTASRTTCRRRCGALTRDDTAGTALRRRCRDAR